MSGRNPDPRGYYALLHVSPDANRHEIGRAFRALMRRRHPDVGHPDAGGPAAAADDPADGDVRAILEAFAVLRDPVARAAYDAGTGPAAGESDAHDPGGATAEDAGTGGRDLPVRIIRRRDPLVRVFPVRWER